MDIKLKRVSKFISLVLRHDPQAAGLELDENGWAQVDALISGANAKGLRLNRDILEEVVRTNEKKRFSFDESGRRIRANQGHSIAVDVELEEMVPPEILYHGTASRSLEAILSEGLKKMSRQHVHLSPDAQTARKVGERHGSPVILRVLAKEMSQSGVPFYLSKNGVWLVEEVRVEFLRIEQHDR